ncbi:MAG: class I SAM-dependent methyltransferase [Phycisphaerales bacterium]|nr:class I SAM-dependent methyltransferase [Phycisphaerales bacterium]
MRSLYESDYFTGREYLDYRADEPFFRKTFRRRLQALCRRRSTGRLLEIGAAYGFFGDLAARHFAYVGFEVNTEAALYSREQFGLNVYTDDFLEINPARLDGSFDVTVMWDVLEHLARPDLFLHRIGQLSHPGSLLCLTTGDIGSVLARIRGRRWRMIHPPTHLHYFDRRTLTRLLANHGFRVVEVRSEGTARSVRQVIHSIMALGLKRPDLYRRFEKHLSASWGFTLNTFDIMFVVSEKVDKADHEGPC